MSGDLSWNLHINNIVNKARSRLGLVKRSIGSNVSSDVKKVCYTGLVRPLIEYCTSLWCPHNKNLILLLESIQRQATKFILNDYDSSYNDRLSKLNLLPLSYRREYLDLVFLFNAMHDLNVYNVNFIIRPAN